MSLCPRRHLIVGIPRRILGRQGDLLRVAYLEILCLAFAARLGVRLTPGSGRRKASILSLLEQMF